MLKNLENKKGFTLVELIIVIAILAIIMLIAIPNFSGIQQRMQVRADKSTAAQIGKAVRVWFTDYTTDKGLVAAAPEGTIIPVAGKNADDDVLEGLPTADDTAVVEYGSLAGISGYISTGKTPDSLKDGVGGAQEENQYYCITLTDDATSAGAKILVSICKGAETDRQAGADGELNTSDDLVTIEPDPTGIVWTVTEPDYDGSRPAIAYIEP